MSKSVRIAVAAGAALAGLSTFASAAVIPGLRYVDQYTLPYSPGVSGSVFNNTVAGGLSGIDFDSSNGTYWAISDDRSQIAPAGQTAAARFYNLAINFDQNGFAASSPVTINSVTTLQRPDGSSFPSAGVDPESIRIAGGTSRTLFWTSEGAAAASSNPPVQAPFVREMTLGGSHLRELSTPARYTPDAAGVTQTQGVRNNLSFECLTLSFDQTKVFAATENGLQQDGPAAAVGVPTPSRVLRYDRTTGAAEAEFVYLADAVVDAPVPAGQFATNGLVELLAINDNEFLAMERSFSTGAAGRGNNIRIYRTSLTGASDVSGLNSLLGQSFSVMPKELLIEFPAGGTVNPDNIEGITLGPVFADGSPSVLLVSDNNFSATQATQFVLLSVPEPGSLSLIGLLCGLVRRRRIV